MGVIVAGLAIVPVVILAIRDDPVTPVETSTTTTPSVTTIDSNPEVSSAPQPTGQGEGSVNLLAHAKTRFDDWTRAPTPAQQDAMRELYDWMVVYSPYFDERLDWYANGLVYADLYAIYVDKESETRALEHPEWILEDSAGERVYIDWGCEAGSCPQWAADVGNPEFREDFVERVGKLLDLGYPGVMIDDVNLLWRFTDGSNDVTPLDPRTGGEMRLEDWQGYVVELVEQVRAEYPDAKIMHNSIWYADSPEHSSPLVERQIASADWIMLERGASDRGLTGGDGRYSLDSFMRFIDLAHSLGTNVLLLDETAETIEEQVYNLAVYLLVNDGSDLVTTEDYPLIAPESTWPAFGDDLGDALGPRYRWNDLWRRDFAGGTVLVNDPESSGRTVELDTPGLTLDGAPVTELTVPGHSAVILKDG